MLDCLKFCPMYGLCAKTSVAITADASCLPLGNADATALSMALSTKGEGAYTRLLLTNGISHEEVTVTLSNGKLVMQRGSNPLALPKCSTIWFEPATAATIKDLMCQCAAEDADPDEEDVAGVAKIPGLVYTGTDENGQPCYEWEQKPCTWRNKTHELTWNGETITKEPLESSEILADAIYSYPKSITVVDGCVVKIEAGSSPFKCSGCSARCAGCDTSEPEADPALSGMAT